MTALHCAAVKCSKFIEWQFCGFISSRCRCTSVSHLRREQHFFFFFSIEKWAGSLKLDSVWRQKRENERNVADSDDIVCDSTTGRTCYLLKVFRNSIAVNQSRCRRKSEAEVRRSRSSGKWIRCQEMLRCSLSVYLNYTNSRWARPEEKCRAAAPTTSSFGFGDSFARHSIFTTSQHKLEVNFNTVKTTFFFFALSRFVAFVLLSFIFLCSSFIYFSVFFSSTFCLTQSSAGFGL